MERVVLVDTNIWVYAFGIGKEDEKWKFLLCESLLMELTEKGFVIYAPKQVAKELGRVALKYGLNCDEKGRMLEKISRVAILLSEEVADIKLACELMQSYNLQYWDALIYAIAIRYNIPLVITEDKTYPKILYKNFALEIVNPF
jgi:predicted nucleic acid-binding protein